MKNLNMIVWLTQLGFSIVSPLVLCILLAVWLQGRFSLGGWVVFVGILMGLGGSISALVNSMKTMQLQAKAGEKDRKDPPVSFNEHS